MKRLSLAVSRTAFSCGSCSWARRDKRQRAMSPTISKYTTNQCGSLIDLIDLLDHLSRVVINHNSMDGQSGTHSPRLQTFDSIELILLLGGETRGGGGTFSR